jgi:hypothetical protein
MNDNINNPNDQNADDLLKKFIQQQESEKGVNIKQEQTSSLSFNNPSSGNNNPPPEQPRGLDYLNMDFNDLPCGRYYPEGTRIQIRAAKVSEVQAYSVVDNRNIYDVTEKMNDILRNCIRFTHADGKLGSYLDIKDGDRLYLILSIRSMTFAKGPSLYLSQKCKCGVECTIDMDTNINKQFPTFFVNYTPDEDIEPFFNNIEKKYVFPDYNVKLGPPTIGLQKSFYDHIKKQVAEKKDPNVSFMKVVPYIMSDRTGITPEGCEAKEKDYANMEMMQFQFLNYATDKLKFGVKELKKQCSECGEEVHTEMRFPGGASNIFAIPDPFRKPDRK